MIYAITLSLIREIVIRENEVDTRGERKNGIIYRKNTDDYRRNRFFWKRSSVYISIPVGSSAIIRL